MGAIMQLSLLSFDLPLRHTFTISRESIDVQPTLIVVLQQDGVRGYGEATANDYYGHSIQRMSAALAALRPRLAEPLEDPERLWDELHAGPLRDEPFAHCALDQAACDLWARLQGRPLWQCWGLDAGRGPHSNFTIGIAEPEVMAEKLREAPGWPCYKIKLGCGDPQRDLAIVRRLRQETDATFRVDANCGWTAEQTIAHSRPLAELGVEFIEQPLPPDQNDQMPRVCEQSVLPLAADESCQTPADIPQLPGRFQIANVKLVKCGGLTPARRMIRQARELGLRPMVGCMTESTVGIGAIAQLLPLLDYVDMDGACLLARDIASGPQVVRGHCQLNQQPGTGVELLEEGREQRAD